MKAPKIRFKGFEGDWEEKKIDNICNRFDNLRIPISAKNRIPGSIPYYWANGIQDYIDWYTHNWEFLLIAEDWANDLKDYPIQYVKWKIWVNNHAHVLQWKQELSNNIFLKYAIKHTNIESLLVWWWRAKLNASVLMWIDISLPSLPEQEKIWALFEQLDSHISKNQQKLEKLKNMKHSFLQKLFPKAWTTVPELRFKGFEGAWKEKKLGEICNKIKEKNTNWIFSETFTNSAEFWIISQKDFFDHDISNIENLKWYYIVENNDFVYNPRISNFAPVWPINRNKLRRTWVMSPLYTILRFCWNNFIFLEYLFKNSVWHNYMFLNWDSGARSDRFSIKDDVFFKMPLRIPSLPEQEKIWALFEQLDSHISKNQQKLEKLKNMKQSFLQKLFPKDWSALPELRFKGFEGAWEERKLGELFEERHEVSTITEDYPQLSFSIAEWVIKPEDRKTNKRDFLIIDKTNKKYLKTELDDIIYNPSNIVFWAIHRNWLCKWVVSPIYKIFSTQQDSIFMDSLVTRKIFINETKKFLEWTVTKLRSLKPEAFLNIKVLISSEIKEQRRIWQLFNVIDKQIKLYEPQIQKLQNLKQSLLEKMFI